MKTIEEILEDTMCCTIEEDADLGKTNYYYQHDDVVKAMEQAQKEAYNQALLDATFAAEIETVVIEYGMDYIRQKDRVNPNSIMKLKK